MVNAEETVARFEEHTGSPAPRVAARRAQDVAARKRDHARRQVERKVAALGRMLTSLRLWQERVKRYEKLAQRTDAEVAAARAARKAKEEARAAGTARRALRLT